MRSDSCRQWQVANGNDVKFSSRKFIVTMTCIVATVALAYVEKMTGDVAIVLGACVAAYNWANAKTTKV